MKNLVIYNVVIVCLILSCKKDINKQVLENTSEVISKNAHYIKSYNSVNQDSISYDLWYKTAFLLPEQDIPKNESVEKEIARLSTITHEFRDSLSNLIKNGNYSFADNDSITNLIRKIIKHKDYNLYCSSTFFYYPLSLFLAEEYKFYPAYGDIVNGFRTKEMRRKAETGLTEANEMSLDNISENEKNLTLYCLIMSYKKGNVILAEDLAFYFKEGLYFSQNTNAARELALVYENKPIIKME